MLHIKLVVTRDVCNPSQSFALETFELRLTVRLLRESSLFLRFDPLIFCYFDVAFFVLLQSTDVHFCGFDVCSVFISVAMSSPVSL